MTSVTRNAGGHNLWIKCRSTGFIQDIVSGWNDQDFKGNFSVSCFAGSAVQEVAAGRPILQSAALDSC